MRRRVAFLAVSVLLVAVGIWWWSGGGAGTVAPAPRGTGVPDTTPGAASAGRSERQVLAASAPDEPAAGAAAAASPEPAGTLAVLVVEERGIAVPGCKVTADEQTATTTTQGRVELELPARRLHLRVEPPPGTALLEAGGWQTVHAGRTTELRIVLPAGRSYAFCCRLVAAEDGKPLAGIALSGPGLVAEVKSDARGHAQIVVGTANEWVDAAGAGRARRRILPEPGHYSEPQALAVPLAAEATLAVSVVDVADAPFGNVPVRLSANPWDLQWPVGARPRGPSPEWKLATDARGIATFSGLPAGALLDLAVTAPPPHAAAPLVRCSLATGANERKIVLQATAAIRGRVLDADSRPLSGIVVRALEAEGPGTPRAVAGFHAHKRGVDAPPTDAAGEFALTGLAPGAWWLGLAQHASLLAVIERIELAPGARADLTLRVHQSLAVAGRASTPSGAPAVGLVVNALVDDDYLLSCRTDGSGRFRLAPLPPGDCELALDPFEGDLDLPRPVRVAAGNEDVELRLEAVRGGIAGRVEPAAEAWVMLMRRGHDDQISKHCDLDGTFHYPGLAAGTWDLHAMGRAGNVACLFGVEVAGGRVTGGLRLELAPAGRITVQDPEADEFLVVRGEEVAYRDALPNGAASEALVPPGTWTVVYLRAGREKVRREITVRAGS